ncbi:DUF2624 domain-containing protein [Oceanobacillus piezotolerans]|uniref:DUF2624 domain-containing protein n=1 Tax=Oceanobacillus piezotolerans TaxID=2448030 RepID=A0A498D9R3_9BACI|nr:DUF2624 domain-containing protein [Oceanobacillus piezotolerans]RLL48063.1 DUF2624 domain-containing protein [Oceanobacillus piezotolerans]
MSFFIKELVKTKIKQINENELLHYGKQYGFSLTNAQAAKITKYLKQSSLDPFKARDREKMFQDLEAITDRSTALKAKKLLHEIVDSYGLGHLFE